MIDTIVRAPNHLGDLIMALPAIESLQPADVLVSRWLMPVLELAGLEGEAIPFERGARGMAAAARELRRRGYRRGVLLAPSFSAALLFALGGVRERRGATSDGRRLLITEPVPDVAMAGLHRGATYHVLARGKVPAPLPAPRVAVPERLQLAWQEFVRAEAHGARAGEWVSGGAGESGGAGIPEGGGSGAGQSAGDPNPADAGVAPTAPLPQSPTPLRAWAHGLTIGLFPGSNAPSRRWEAGRFAELARRLVAAGAKVTVFGGAGDRELTREVAGDVAFDAGGRTPLPLLAAGLAACHVLVTNDSGPMHLAAAVNTRTVSLQGPSDPARTRPLGDAHVLVRHAELACVPCVRNDCPRQGAGTFLPYAKGECLALMTVDEVERAVRGALAGPGLKREESNAGIGG